MTNNNNIIDDINQNTHEENEAFSHTQMLLLENEELLAQVHFTT